MNPFVIAALISGGASLVSAFMAKGQQKEANDLNNQIAQANLELQRMDFEERKKVNAFMQKMALSPTENPLGDRSQYIEGRGFVSTPGEITQRQLDQDKLNQSYNQNVNLPQINRNNAQQANLGNQEARLSEQLLGRIGQNEIDPRLLQSRLNVADNKNVLQNFQGIASNITQQGARTGQDMSSLIANLVRQKSRALQQQRGGSDNILKSLTTANQLNSSNLVNTLNAQQVLGNSARTRGTPALSPESNLASVLQGQGNPIKNVLPQFNPAFQTPSSPLQNYVAPDLSGANLVNSIGNTSGGLAALLLQNRQPNQPQPQLGATSLFTNPTPITTNSNNYTFSNKQKDSFYQQPNF